MAAKDNVILDRRFLDQMWEIVDDVKPPPPPPPPEDSVAKMLSSGIAGSILLVVGNSISSPGVPLEGFAGEGIIRWIITGFILGAIFGGLGSVIYNLILRNSRASKIFKSSYTEAQKLSPQDYHRYWIENRFGYFYLYVNEKFAEKPASKSQ